MSHADGPAADVPVWLRAMASPDPEARERAFSGFYSAAHHQGDVYACTAASLPFLFALADDPTAPDRTAAARSADRRHGLARCPGRGHHVGPRCPAGRPRPPHPLRPGDHRQHHRADGDRPAAPAHPRAADEDRREGPQDLFRRAHMCSRRRNSITGNSSSSPPRSPTWNGPTVSTRPPHLRQQEGRASGSGTGGSQLPGRLNRTENDADASRSPTARAVPQSSLDTAPRASRSLGPDGKLPGDGSVAVAAHTTTTGRAGPSPRLTGRAVSARCVGAPQGTRCAMPARR